MSIKVYKGKQFEIDPTDEDTLDKLFQRAYESRESNLLDDLKQLCMKRDVPERYLIILCRHLLNHRVTKLEKKLKRNVLAWVDYCRNFTEINTIHIPKMLMSWEATATDKAMAALFYCRDLAHCRVIELEEFVVLNPMVAHAYSKDVIGDVWEDATRYMTTDQKDWYFNWWEAYTNGDDPTKINTITMEDLVDEDADH